MRIILQNKKSKLINIFANFNTPFKTTKQMVSVILPFYRPGMKLEDAIESIVNQSFTDWELILVNNNACEISSAIAYKWSETDQRVRVITEPVQSVAHAMNTGLRHAWADLVARMDADDISLPGRLKKQVEYMTNNPGTGAVATQTIFSTDIKKSKGFSLYADWQNSLITHREHYLAQFVESPLAQPTIMFRKELIDLYGYYNTENLPEDYELWLRWFEQGVRFYKIPETLVRWNDHSERLTRTNSNYSADAFLHVRYKYLARWLKKNITPGKNIIVCGSSKNIIRKAENLAALGIRIFGFTDVKPKSSPDLNIVPYQDLTDPKKYFILNLISKRGVGQDIRRHFKKLGFTEGKDFLLAG